MWRRILDLLHAARRPLVVIDFETSGLNGAPPVEYAVAIWAPWQEAATDEVTERARLYCPPGLTYAATARLNPGGPVHPDAQRVHGITAEDVRGCLPWNDMALSAGLRSLAMGDPDAEGGPEGPAIFVGHNAAESDIPWAQVWGYVPRDPLPAVVDTMRMQRRLTKEHPMPLQPDVVGMSEGPWRRFALWAKCPAVGHGLEPYASSLIGLHTVLFGDPPEESHGAMADVMSTARCLHGMLELWAPLWPGSVSGEDPFTATDAMVSALNTPLPRALSWDGWLRIDRDTGAITWSGKAGKIGGEGTALTADRGYAEWVAALPASPTGINGKAWCSDATRQALADAAAGKVRPPPKKIGQIVNTTRTP